MRKNFWLGSLLALSLMSSGSAFADTAASQQYTIAAGDTLKVVAQKFGVTLSQLIAANPQISNFDMISVGMEVYIPAGTPASASTPTAAQSSNPANVSTSIPPASPSGTSSTAVSVTSGQQYTVVSGDTLKVIAQKFGVTLSQLIAANPQIPDYNMISIGIKVNIPTLTVGTSTPTSTSATTSTNNPAPAQTGTASVSSNSPTNGSAPPSTGGTLPIAVSSGQQQYTVIAGDTLKVIAQKFGVTLSQLIAANPQISNFDMISIGMKINVSMSNSSTSSTVVANNTVPVVSATTTASAPVSTSVTSGNTVKPLWEQKADAIIATGMTQLGVPYVFGGSEPGVAFDCSGFTQFAFGQNGYDLPHSSVMQSELGTPVDKNNLRKGDLIFLQNTYTPGVSHVAIYMGNNQILQAGTMGTREVKISQLFGVPYYDEHYWGAKRIIQD